MAGLTCVAGTAFCGGAAAAREAEAAGDALALAALAALAAPGLGFALGTIASGAVAFLFFAAVNSTDCDDFLLFPGIAAQGRVRPLPQCPSSGSSES